MYKKSFISKVLKSLQSQMENPAPTPFAVNAQYKSAFKGEKSADPDDAELAKKPSVKKPANNSKKKKLKKRPDVKAVAKAAAAASSTDGNVYQAHAYAKLREDFIAKLKADGASHSEAADKWGQSEQKKKLLCTLSVGELKRRRFIGKDETTNPWAQ